MVDRLHQRGVGVIFDWVPSHFPIDAHGLARFDGTHLYEHADPRQGYHPDWTSAIFNYGRSRGALVPHLERPVRGSTATTSTGCASTPWPRCCTSTTPRADGEWIPNRLGGRENLDAIDFLRQLNDAIARGVPGRRHVRRGVDGVADGHRADGERRARLRRTSGTWAGCTTRCSTCRREPVHRRFHHDEITFRGVYAFTERYVLPLSHDEVVHGKGSLLGKMPGDEWQRFANLRLLYGMMWTQPGKKLLFMGGELATPSEWNHEATLDWSLHDAPAPRRRAALVAALNDVYRSEPALARGDADPAGFSWIIGDDDTHSVFAWLRPDPTGEAPPVLAVVNATPTVHYGYRVGVPAGRPVGSSCSTPTPRSTAAAAWATSAASAAEDQPWHGSDYSLPLTLPPLAVVLLRPDLPHRD